MSVPFDSWRDYSDFCSDVKHRNRFIRSYKSERFLSALQQTLNDRSHFINKNVPFYRSQIGHNWEEVEGTDVPRPFGESRMFPDTSYSANGRMNAQGIHCLYLADKTETCIAESRPQVGDVLSVGTFLSTRQLKVINCHRPENYYGYPRLVFGEPKTPQEMIDAVWSRIADAFTMPVNSSSIDYVPTQIITELIKKNGHDGLFCKSHLGEGFNLALFDNDMMALKSVQLFEVSEVNVIAKECDNPTYFKVLEMKGE